MRASDDGRLLRLGSEAKHDPSGSLSCTFVAGLSVTTEGGAPLPGLRRETARRRLSLSRSRRFGARTTVVLVLSLALITLLGTLAASREGVLEAQARYFTGFVAWQDLPLGWRLPLPGARLLLWLMLASLLLNRAAWHPQPGRKGVVVVHLAVAVLLGGAVLAPGSRDEGMLWLAPDSVAHSYARPDGADQLLPFGLRLLAHRRQLHPGTRMVAEIEADVEVLDAGGGSIAARITPNQPLHRDGYSIYLPTTRADAPTDLGATRLLVARDPGRTALLATSVLLGVALALHFGFVLWRHVQQPRASR